MTNAFDIELNDSDLRRALVKTLSRLNDSRPLMASIAHELLSATKEAFIDEGPEWPALAPATVAAREASGHGAHPILRVTNALSRSIVTRHSKDEAAVGTNLAYAAIHQLGGLAGRNKSVEIPARPYLPIGEDRQLTGSVREAVLKTVNRVLADLR